MAEMDIAVILLSLPETIHTRLYAYDERKYLLCTMFKAFKPPTSQME